MKIHPNNDPVVPCSAAVRDEKGFVLVMVMLMLVAVIIIGVAVVRSSTMEVQIAGNELYYKDAFYDAEGVGDFVISEFDTIASSMDLSEGTAASLDTELASMGLTLNSGDTASLTFISKGTPPVSEDDSDSPYGVAGGSAYFYKTDTVKNNQHVEAGVWKYFPNP